MWKHMSYYGIQGTHANWIKDFSLLKMQIDILWLNESSFNTREMIKIYVAIIIILKKKIK